MHGFRSERVWTLRCGSARRKMDWSGAATWLAGWVLLMVPAAGWAQVATTLNGPPVQVTPYVQEPGVPLITIVPGTPSPPPGTGGGSGTETGAGGGSEDGGGNGSGSDPLTTMLSASWGITALGNAEAVGINPSALAATCVLESGCGASLGSGGAQGVFQMFPAAYQEGLQTALAANSQVASQIVPGSAGMNDPTTEAIAASGYLIQGGQALQNAGISNPTTLDVRSYFNFGPAEGAAIAQASGDDLMSNYLTADVMSANGIRQNETVGEWRAQVAAIIGNAANEPVFSG